MTSLQNKNRSLSFLALLKKDVRKHPYIYLLAIPVALYYAIFCYVPMYGASIAFMDFRPGRGMFGSEWVGFRHFADFFAGRYFWRLMRNTFLISMYGLLFVFPVPIVFAMLLNEIRSPRFKRTVQVVSYLPHFISVVVICSMIINFTSPDGLINKIIELMGGEASALMMNPKYFRTIYIASEVWTHTGWKSIVYIAAIASINPELFEAAEVDGAGRLQKMIHILIPGIAPTIIILLILQLGAMLTVGWEKIVLLYVPSTYETADVLSSYVYRRGLMESDFGFATAVGLFNSVVSFFFLVVSNALSRRVSETSLW